MCIGLCRGQYPMQYLQKSTAWLSKKLCLLHIYCEEKPCSAQRLWTILFRAGSFQTIATHWSYRFYYTDLLKLFSLFPRTLLQTMAWIMDSWRDVCIKHSSEYAFQLLFYNVPGERIFFCFKQPVVSQKGSLFPTGTNNTPFHQGLES